MALTNTELGQLLQDTIDGWQSFVTSVKNWGSGVTDTTTFEDPLGGPDIVVSTLNKITTDYANLTGAEWAITIEDTLVPSGNLVDEYSALHWAKKAQTAAAGVASVAAEVTAAQTAAAEAQEWATTAVDVFVPSGDLATDYSALHWAMKSSDQVTLAAAQVTLAAAEVALAQTAKTNAETAEANASTHAGTAATQAGVASGHADSANTYASNSLGHANNSLTYSGQAWDAADYADKIATELEDVQVGLVAGTYSAFHWSKKAEAFAAGAATTEFDALTDVDLTGRIDGMVAYYDLAADKVKFKVGGGGAVDSVAGKTGVVTLVEADITDLGTYSPTTHNHTGVYEPADATIVKDADIGVSVAAQVHTHTGTYEPADATILKDVDIGVNVAAQVHTHTGTYEPADATIVKDADIGVNVAAQVHTHTGVYEPADATLLKDADIGSTVASQAHTHSGVYEPADGTILKDADIGSSVEGYAVAVSQAEAEAGVSTAKRTWTPQRVSQAIAALGGGGGAGGWPAAWTTTALTADFTAAVGTAYRLTAPAQTTNVTLPATFAADDLPIYLWNDSFGGTASYFNVQPSTGDTLYIDGNAASSTSTYQFITGGEIVAIYPLVANTSWIAIRVASSAPSYRHTPLNLNNQEFSGPSTSGTTYEFESFGTLICVDTAAGFQATDADSMTRMPVVAMKGRAPATNYGTLILPGAFVRDDTAFAGFTDNTILYASNTQGAITATPPSTTGSIVQVVGVSLGGGEILFNPSADFFEVA